jgi:hypothetical protein
MTPSPQTLAVMFSRVIVWAVIGLLLMAGAAYGWQHRGCFAQVTCTRVLFIGNSYTSVNDLPFAFEQLAESAGQAADTGVQAPGGSILQDQAGDSETAARIEAQPRVDLRGAPGAERDPGDHPASSVADGSHGSTPLLFETWAHRAGLPGNGLPDYHSMQAAIDRGYAGLSGLVTRTSCRLARSGMLPRGGTPLPTSGSPMAAIRPWKGPTWPRAFSTW